MESFEELRAALALRGAEAREDYEAQLPEMYLAAKRALSECDRVDECLSWSGKALAMAVYARQMKDKSLLNYAKRIQARAVRRYGELLAEIKTPKFRGNQYSETTYPEVVKRSPSPDHFSGNEAAFPEAEVPRTRYEAAVQAGLSKDQAKTGLRIASLPKEEFERQVESEDVPGVSALAKQGTVHRSADVKNEDSAKLTLALKRFLQKLYSLDIRPAVDGLEDEEVGELIEAVEQCLEVLQIILDFFIPPGSRPVWDLEGRVHEDITPNPEVVELLAELPEECETILMAQGLIRGLRILKANTNIERVRKALQRKESEEHLFPEIASDQQHDQGSAPRHAGLTHVPKQL